MRRKSEFVPALNNTYISLGIGLLCLEDGKFFREQSSQDIEDSLNRISNKIDKLSSDCIASDSLSMLSDVDCIESRLEFINARVELCIIMAHYLEN